MSFFIFGSVVRKDPLKVFPEGYAVHQLVPGAVNSSFLAQMLTENGCDAGDQFIVSLQGCDTSHEFVDLSLRALGPTRSLFREIQVLLETSTTLNLLFSDEYTPASDFSVRGAKDLSKYGMLKLIKMLCGGYAIKVSSGFKDGEFSVLA